MAKPNPKIRGWSVAGQRKLDTIKPDKMPAAMIEQITQEAKDQAVADVFGADWKQHVDVHGRPQEQGIGSTAWLLNVEEGEAERHYQSLERFSGPGAARAERERIAKLKQIRGK